jgi:glycosyltransferase involved in cell wall biosynthesis
MRIAIDARELAGRPTGAGRYLGQLLAHWERLPAARGHTFVLYAHQTLARHYAALDVRLEHLPGKGGSLWEQVTLARAVGRERFDVLFSPAYTAPILVRTPVALAVHDVSFAAHPEWFRWREGLRRRWVTRQSARRARVVLTLSAFSRDEIVGRLGVDPLRIRVVPLGVGLDDDDERPAPDSQMDRPPIILFVGSLFNRRHVPALVEAMPIVLAHVPDARLVIVGDNRTWPREDPAARAAQLGVGARVAVEAFVPDDRLRALYRQAAVFAFLSEYEGFGLTPLEALASGVPILVLDMPVAREIYGAAAEYVQDVDPAVVAAGLVRLLLDPSRRAERLAARRDILDRYRWRDTAAATLAAIEEAAG